MTRVIITDRITWWERFHWIMQKCETARDNTNWAMWQLGLSDIEFSMSEKDAIMYYLLWS
jgi:hypothetical protein